MTIKTRKMPPLIREEKEQLDPELLYLTYEELEKIVCGSFKRFKVTFDQIPSPLPDESDYNPNNYREKDGREYRQVTFIDNETKKEYHMGYTYAPYGWEFPESINSEPTDIVFVDESVIADKKNVFDFKPKERKKLSEKNQKAKKLMRQYKRMALTKTFVFEDSDIPDHKLRDLKKQLKGFKNNFSMADLQLLIIPVCIEYKIENGSLWVWVRDSKDFKPRNQLNSKKIMTLSENLIDSLVEKYSITSYDNFTCPIIKDIAKELKYFG